MRMAKATVLALIAVALLGAALFHYRHRQNAPLTSESLGIVAIPADERPTTAAANPALAAFLDPSRSDRLSADFPARVPSVHADEDITALIAVVRNRDDGDTERHQAIEVLRRSHAAGLDDVIWALLESGDERERFRAFLAQHVGTSCLMESDEERRGVLIKRLRSLLDDDQRFVRREALLGLVRLRDDTAIGVVHFGLDDPSWRDCRDLIVQSAFALDDRTLTPAIRPLTYDEDISLRVAAINALGGWRDEPSRTAFLEAQGSTILRLRRAGELALARLDGRAGPALLEPVAFFVSR